MQAGESYEELRGVMFECETIIHEDNETVLSVGMEIFARNTSPWGEAADLHLDLVAVLERQAPSASRCSSWR